MTRMLFFLNAVLLNFLLVTGCGQNSDLSFIPPFNKSSAIRMLAERDKVNLFAALSAASYYDAGVRGYSIEKSLAASHSLLPLKIRLQEWDRIFFNFENRHKDIELYFFFSKRMNDLVIAIRGTEKSIKSIYKDWIATNLNSKLLPYEGNKISGTSMQDF